MTFILPPASCVKPAIFFRELVKTTQKLKSGENFRTKERKFVPDFMTSSLGNNLMTYETGKGSTKTVFGGAYDRIGQKYTPDIPNPEASLSEKTFFHADLYGSPLLATDEAGNIRRVSSLGIWGEGETTLPDTLDENLRFSTYRYDSAIGKYYGNARFYDPKAGRMLAIDPIKRGINGYGYCDNDPVNEVDPDGNVPQLVTALIGGAGGALFGFGRGFVQSVISQKLSGNQIDWHEAVGEGIYGAVSDGTRGLAVGLTGQIGLITLADAAGGALGSVAKQWYLNGNLNDIDYFEVAKDAVGNAINGYVFGKGRSKTLGEEAKRGAKAIGLTTAFDYLTDYAKTRYNNNRFAGLEDSMAIGADIGFRDAYAAMPMSKDPRRGCGESSTFTLGISPYSADRIGAGLRAVQERRAKENEFSLVDFGLNVAAGTALGAIESAGAYKFGQIGKKGYELYKQYKKTRSPKAHAPEVPLLTTSSYISGKTEDHHIIPKFRGKSEKYANFISERGIDVDLYTVIVGGGKGGYHLNSIHGKGKWNVKWIEFIEDNPNASAKDIYQFAGKMLDDYGLNGFNIHPYRKKIVLCAGCEVSIRL
ncbi:MAG: DUF2380 domain-containing protein [Lachnospiraceae bacterium]|nr:DUF2380 domain-containing protein [Lachnospiraceae bacterium]